MKTHPTSPKIHAVDLFCGVGGLTHGLRLSGIDVRLGVDIDPACQYPYTRNNNAEFLLKSVEKITGDEILPFYGKSGLKLLAGCAPCQTFSTYNQKACDSDKRWWLLRHFSRLIDEVNPDLVTMENVPRLADQNVFAEFIEHLEKKKKYQVFRGVVDCSEYGVPQQRNRLVTIASRLGKVRLLSPEEFGRKPKTVEEAIGSLPPLEAGKVDPYDSLHQCASLSEKNLRRIQASKPGGTWQDWPEHLVTECHKKRTGTTYKSVYGRMRADMPAPTMTTQFYGFGSGRFGHPTQDRALSLREGAMLQSFPIDYKFVPEGKKVIRKVIGRLIGNAVPVTLGEVIGRSLVEHVMQSAHNRTSNLDENDLIGKS